MGECIISDKPGVEMMLFFSVSGLSCFARVISPCNYQRLCFWSSGGELQVSRANVY